MPETTALPSLGAPADEADWRALVAQGLKGAAWDTLIAHTADGISIQPLYREPDCATATGVSGFIRGARTGAWLIRQSFDHPEPERANRDILADLEGGVSSIEIVAAGMPGGRGVQIQRGEDFDVVLAGVMLDAAPVSLDAGAHALWLADLLAAKLKGVAGADVAFNLDPVGQAMRAGAMRSDDIADAARFALRMRDAMPAATTLRVDARPAHEAGATEAQEIAVALSTGILYLRALTGAGLGAREAAATLLFTMATGADVLVEAAKLRALRLCWARITEAAGAASHARIHAVTSRRMLTRYDAWTNILRITTSALAAAIGGAEAITTLPFTDALGLPTPFARRLARNTQHVLLEEARLDHVADPAGGAWFVEKLTRELAEAAWMKMQTIEAAGGVLEALRTGMLTGDIGEARRARQHDFDTRRASITGVSDFPQLEAQLPDFEPMDRRRLAGQHGDAGEDAGGPCLAPIRWAARFEELRDRAERASRRPAVFFANLGPMAEFAPRASFARNLVAIGGVGAIGAETQHATVEALAADFAESGARVAVMTGSDACYAEHAASAAHALKAAGCDWLILAGMPHDAMAGIDQALFDGQDCFAALSTLHAALGLAS